MSRRGLSRNVKRVPPSADALARYLNPWTFEDTAADPGRLPPVDAASMFAPEPQLAPPPPAGTPLVLEVGCGTGEFLNALAAAHPEQYHLGIDPSTKSCYLCVRRADEMGLTNVRYVRCPIDPLYPRLVPGALSAIYCHFPDPFVRGRGFHRVLNPTFLTWAHAALAPNGFLSVVSDKRELFFEVLELIQESGRWDSTLGAAYLEGYEPPVRSRYQIKWERLDVTPLRLEVCPV